MPYEIHQNLKTISGHSLSKVCFGTMQFGDGSDHEISRSLYLECRAHEINHFDTAHAYTNGLAETWLGEFLQKERENVFVASKVGYVGGAAPQAELHAFGFHELPLAGKGRDGIADQIGTQQAEAEAIHGCR